MKKFTLADMATAIGAVQDRLDAIEKDLAVMPAFKVNSQFHLDRTAERQRLLAQREFLRGKQAEWASLN